MDETRKSLFLNQTKLLDPSNGYGVAWQALDNELVISSKVLLMGGGAMDSWRFFVENNLQQEVITHPTNEDTYSISFRLGEHEIEIVVSIFHTARAYDISYKQKMFEQADVIVMEFSSHFTDTFTDIITKWYPNSSQYSPESPLFLMETYEKGEEKVISKKQTRELVQTISARTLFATTQGDAISIGLAFDKIIRTSIVERMGKPGALLIKKWPRVRMKTKKIELVGLPMTFIKEGSPAELAEIAKKYNIRQVDGQNRPSVLVACEVGNMELAKKILELDNGILNLSDCNLESTPEIILQWGEQGLLKELNISQNMLQTLPIELRFLKKVILDRNPLQTIPVGLRKAKWSKIKKYLEQIASRAAQWDVRKLLIVGEEGVGKTTLIRCIEARGGKTDVSVNLATDGIEIHNIEMRAEKDKDAILFSTWDLGGQLIFYPTHQFFLSSGAIYIIVFNMECVSYPRVEYWMKQIKMISHDSSTSIVMVGTHIENCTEQDIQCVTATLLSKFPKHTYPAFQCHVFPVSARTSQGIRELKKSILQLATSPQLAPVVPVGWVQLHELVSLHRQNGTNYADWNTYVSWNSRCGIQPENIGMATEHLHRSGSLIHFDTPELTDFVVLNPQWLADIMSSFISIKRNFVKDGFIQSSFFPQILTHFPVPIHQKILDLLEKFRIIYPLGVGKEKYIVPSLLPHQRPAAEIIQAFPLKLPEATASIGRVFQFGQLPLGLFGRLIVSLLHSIEATGKVFWRHGLITSTPIGNGSPLTMILEYERNKFYLSVYIRYDPTFTQEATKIWRNILETIQSLVKNFYQSLLSNLSILIPCIHCLRKQKYHEKVYLFTYEECEASYRAGDGLVYCQGIKSPSRSIFVSQIAPDIYLADLPLLKDENLIVEQVLGEGGFGTVYKGSLEGEIVAIKELKEEANLNNNIDKFREFQSEAHVMSLLHHPNIVRFYGVLTNPPRIILQFVDGFDLFQFLHPETPNKELGFLAQQEFPWSQRIRIAFHIAQGLHYLQSLTPPVVHRDLRSPNIFITSNGSALIGDFGLAVFVKGSKSVGGALRTWQWLAPEIFDSVSESYDERTDIYSFGIILWELAAIEIPFDKELKSKSASVVKKEIIEKKLRPSIPPPTPTSFVRLIKACWSACPSDRPSTSYILKTLAALMRKYNEVVPAELDIEETRAVEVSFPTISLPKSLSSSSPEAKNQKPLIQQQIDVEEHGEISATLQVLNSLWLGTKHGSIIIYGVSHDNSQLIEQGCMCQHKGRINHFIEVNQTVLSAGEDGFVFVWDKKSYKRLYQWQPFNCESRSMIMKYVTAKPEHPLEPLVETIWIFSPKEGKATIWDLHYNLIHVITHENLLWVGTMAVHQNFLFVGADNSKQIHIYNTTSFDFMGSFKAHDSPLISILSVHNQLWSVSMTDIRVWELKSVFDISCVSTMNKLVSPIRCILSSGSKVIAGCVDGSVLLWDTKNYSIQQEITISNTGKLINLTKDIFSRLWCSFTGSFVIFPNAEDLHSKKVCSISTLRYKKMLPIPSATPPPPPPPRRYSPAVQKRLVPIPPQRSVVPVLLESKRSISSSELVASASPPEETKRKRLTYANSPLRGNTLRLGDMASSIAEKKIKSTIAPLVSPTETTELEPLFLSEEEEKSKRKKKEIKVDLGAATTKLVSKDIRLDKLIALIPDFSMDQIDEENHVQIVVTKGTNGKLEISLKKKETSVPQNKAIAFR